MVFKRVVNVVEIRTLLGVIVFVIALFANEPGGGGAAKSGAGYSIYVANCARCHGQDGEGGQGPKLAGEVTKDFPDIEQQIIVVEEGTGRMPSFKGKLGNDEIRQVVEYTRTGLK